MVEILIVIQQFTASSSHVIAKDLTDRIDPKTILLFRSLFAALIFIVWIKFGNLRKKKIEKKDYLTCLVLGILNVPINQFLFLTSIKMTGAPNVALAYAIMPAFVLIISMAFLKEKVTWRKTAGIFTAIAGTSMILFEKGIDLNSGHFAGNLLALAASVSFAFYTTIGKKMVEKYGGLYMTGITMIIGFVTYMPEYLLISPDFAPAEYIATDWLKIVFLAVMTSAFGYGLWYYALSRLDASKVAVFNNLQPIFTTVLSMIFLGHVLTPVFFVGGIIAISGVLLTQKG